MHCLMMIVMSAGVASGEYRVKSIGKWTKHHVSEQHSGCKYNGEIQRTKSGESADCGRAPNRGSGVQSEHICAVLEDDSRAKKPMPETT